MRVRARARADHLRHDSCTLCRPQDAEKQLDAAVAYKASFLDGYLGKSALAQLRAKLAADYLIVPVK